MSVNPIGLVAGRLWSAIIAIKIPQRLHRAIRFGIVAIAFAATVEPAATAIPPLYSGGVDRADLERIEAYLNSFQNVSGQFRQSASTGEVAQGDLYLERPGKLRIEYKPPTPVIMISNGTILMYYDRDLDQFSHIPLQLSPASILLEERIDLDGEIIDVINFGRFENSLTLTVARHENPEEGAVTLIFEDGPLRLTKWTVIDAQGIRTTVSLRNLKFDTALDPELFELFNPRFRDRDDIP